MNAAGTFASWFANAGTWLAPAAAALIAICGLALTFLGDRVFKPAAILISGLFGTAIALIGACILTAPSPAAPSTLVLAGLLGLGLGIGLCWLAYRWLIAVGMGIVLALACSALAVGVLSLPGPRRAIASIPLPRDAQSGSSQDPRVVVHRAPDDSPAPAASGLVPPSLGSPPSGSLPGVGEVIAAAASRQLTQALDQLKNAGQNSTGATQETVDSLTSMLDQAANNAAKSSPQLGAALDSLKRTGIVVHKTDGSLATNIPGLADLPTMMDKVRTFAAGLPPRELVVIAICFAITCMAGMAWGSRYPRFAGRAVTGALGAAVLLAGGAALIATARIPWPHALDQPLEHWAMAWGAVSVFGVLVQSLRGRTGASPATPVTGSA